VLLPTNTGGELSPAATGFGTRGRGLRGVSHSDSAGTTHFICLTMVLFPDSPAPVEKREGATSSEVLPKAEDPPPSGTPPA